MNKYLILYFIAITYATSGCPVNNCFAYTGNVCYRNRTDSNNVWNIDNYGNNINGKFHYCPVSTTYCDEFQISYTNSTALCLPLKANGLTCISSYQCASGLCIMGICRTMQGSVNIACIINPDCEYGLTCISGKCSKPKTVGQSCNHVTYFGVGLDINDCDYTKKLVCGYTGVGTISYTCISLFSVTTSIYVTNPLMCSTMVTDQGWGSGYCIPSRATNLPILAFDSGKQYKVCSTDLDCSYTLNGSIMTTPSGSCQCAIGDVNAQSYCKFGGGEAPIISDVAFYIKNWVPQINMMDNPAVWRYLYSLDNLLRNTFVNPSYCSVPMFMKNITITPPSLPSVMIFYICVLVLFAIGLAGVIVTFLMC